MATQTAQVTARPRSELGSRANKRLRDTGHIPGVIYGHKEAVVPVTLPKKELTNYLGHGTHLFDLKGLPPRVQHVTTGITNDAR